MQPLRSFGQNSGCRALVKRLTDKIVVQNEITYVSIGTLNPAQLLDIDCCFFFEITLTDYIGLFILDILFVLFEKAERVSTHTSVRHGRNVYWNWMTVD